MGIYPVQVTKTPSDKSLPRNTKLVILSILLFSLNGCVTSPDFDVPSQDPADVEDRVIIDGQALPLPDEDLPIAKPLSAGVVMSPVVRSLLSQARDQRRLGNWDGAAMLLERALRIEPRNASVWSRLADVRFDQQSWRKAIQLAAKSNTLVGNNIDLKRRNWVLMANSYQEIGDSAASEKYLNKLNQ